MSLGLDLEGTLASPLGDPLAVALSYLREAQSYRLAHAERAVDDEGRPTLLLSLHPAAEELVLTDHGASRLTASAKTSTAGPGYHAFVCDVLAALGDALSIEWDPDGDATGYFGSRDGAALEAAFLEWLSWLGKETRTILDSGGSALAVSMPATHEVTHDGAIATPLGPRDRAWLDALETEPERGIDVFPWWHRGDDAREQLGRALALMWMDVRWRPPVTDEERELLEDVVALLESAYRKDASRTYPWHEWAEVLAFLGRDSLLATRAQLKARGAERAPIGYRRRDVRVRLSGGWSVLVPGSFAERWDERSTWCGWDCVRTVWFTSFTLRKEGEEPSADETLAGLPPLEGDVARRTERGVAYAAAFGRGKDAEGDLEQLQAYAAAPGSAAVCTICFETDADRDWALAVWKSLRHHRDA